MNATPLPISTNSDSARNRKRPTASELANDLRQVAENNGFLTMDREPEVPGQTLQTAVINKGRAFTVQYRDIDVDWQETQTDSIDTVVRLFLDWARQTENWGGGITWVPTGSWPVPSLAPEHEAKITEWAKAYIGAGFRRRHEIVEQLIEMAAGDLTHDMNDMGLGSSVDLLYPQANAIVNPLWDESVAEQLSWTEDTDCDRLDKAFEQLNAVGIIAMQNFTCCQNCGSGEIWEHGPEGARGYAFFHQQDTAQAVKGGGVYLSYASASGVDQSAIGQEISTALRDCGLSVSWDGDPKQRILVDLVWQRRLLRRPARDGF